MIYSGNFLLIRRVKDSGYNRRQKNSGNENTEAIPTPVRADYGDAEAYNAITS